VLAPEGRCPRRRTLYAPRNARTPKRTSCKGDRCPFIATPGHRLSTRSRRTPDRSRLFVDRGPLFVDRGPLAVSRGRRSAERGRCIVPRRVRTADRGAWRGPRSRLAGSLGSLAPGRGQRKGQFGPLSLPLIVGTAGRSCHPERARVSERAKDLLFSALSRPYPQAFDTALAPSSPIIRPAGGSECWILRLLAFGIAGFVSHVLVWRNW